MSVISESRITPVSARSLSAAQIRASKVPIPARSSNLVSHHTQMNLADTNSAEHSDSYLLPAFRPRSSCKASSVSPRKHSVSRDTPVPSTRGAKIPRPRTVQPGPSLSQDGTASSCIGKTSAKRLPKALRIPDASPKHSPYRHALVCEKTSAVNMTSAVEDDKLLSAANVFIKPQTSERLFFRGRAFNLPFTHGDFHGTAMLGSTVVVSHEAIMEELRGNDSVCSVSAECHSDFDGNFSETESRATTSAARPCHLNLDLGKTCAPASSPAKSKLFFSGLASPRKPKGFSFKGSSRDLSSAKENCPSHLRKSVSLESGKPRARGSSLLSLDSLDSLTDASSTGIAYPGGSTPTTPLTPQAGEIISELVSDVALRRARLTLPGLNSRVSRSPVPSPLAVEQPGLATPSSKRKFFFRHRHLSGSAPSSPLSASLASPRKCRLALPAFSSPKRLRSPSDSPKKSAFTFAPLSPAKNSSACEPANVPGFGELQLQSCEKDSLSGFLYVNILSGKGFARNADIYCALEIDSYGHYFRKAKTKAAKGPDPQWEEDFDFEVEACSCLRLLCFTKLRLMGDDICGKTTINLARENLRDNRNHSLTVGLDRGAASISLSVSYSTTMDGIKKSKSFSDHGVFGVPIAIVCKREKSDIPVIVISCIKEIEKRGMDEVGIYRLSGVASEIQALKKLFNESTQSALLAIGDADIHAVAGLLKLYFRELPNSLLSRKLYQKFVDGLSIGDQEERELYMLDVLNELSRPNRLTAVYLFEHLKRVSEHEKVNKMGINNLATVFGPTVLRPLSPQDQDNERAALNIGTFDIGALDVMSQVATFKFFLSCKSDRLRLPEDDLELWRRLDPEKASKLEERLMETAEEHLI